MSVSARIGPSTARPAPRSVPAPRSAPPSRALRQVPTPARRSRYDRWIGAIVIAAVLVFCVIAAGAGALLLHHMLAQ